MLSGDPSEMVVTWVTMQATMLSFVEYGTTEMDNLAKGSEETFVDGGSEKRSLFMHRVTITGLTPGQKYSENSFYNKYVTRDYSQIDHKYGVYCRHLTFHAHYVSFRFQFTTLGVH